MKRITALLLAVVMVFTLFAFTACDEQGGPFELALITDVGTIDDGSFNQGSWEGLEAFALARDISHMYWQPAGESTHAYLDAISQAVETGARLIVTPGFLFEPAIWEAQVLYPDVKFVLLDGAPRNAERTDFTHLDNVVAIFYAEEQAGFLAGYAAVMDGFRELGFIGGMAVPAVVRFGYGFLQGADYAAYVLGLDNINVHYHYTGNFFATPETQTLAASWFHAGIEVIFAAGGALGFSVMAAAEANDGFVIGVDIDQGWQSETVITSALKQLGNSVYQSIEAYFAGEFPGGEVKMFDATNDGIGLPMETSRFRQFTVEQYETILARLASGEVVVNSEHEIDIADLGLRFLTITEVN